MMKSHEQNGFKHSPNLIFNLLFYYQILNSAPFSMKFMF
jgi:hypothetical protein